MHASIGDQPEEMKLASAFAGELQRLNDRWMCEKFASGDQAVDAGDVHAHDAPRSNVQMTHFAVAHLSVRQADKVIGGVQQRIRKFGEQLVVRRLARQRDCVVLNLGAVTPSIKDGKDNRSGVNGHFRSLFLILSARRDRTPNPAASMMRYYS